MVVVEVLGCFHQLECFMFSYFPIPNAVIALHAAAGERLHAVHLYSWRVPAHKFVLVHVYNAIALMLPCSLRFSWVT